MPLDLTDRKTLIDHYSRGFTRPSLSKSIPMWLMDMGKFNSRELDLVSPRRRAISDMFLICNQLLDEDEI
jgi:hypothetical protein